MGVVTLGGLRPNPKQIEFFKSEARFTAYGGARGGGKSWAMRRKLVLLALHYSNLKLLLLRSTFAELEGNHIQPLRQELNGIAKYNSEKHTFTFPNGSILQLGYCSSDKEVYQYQGQEYEVIGFEEATNFTEFQLDWIAKTCNRTVRTDFKPRCYYTCNPGGVGHDYIKRLFIDRNFHTKVVVVDGKEIIVENPDDYKFIKATVYDNDALMKADPEYIGNLMSLSEHLRRAYLDGDWDVVQGQYFREFSRDKHVVDPFPLPLAWKRFRSIDIGFNDPTCVLWYAVAPDRRIYVYREIYQVPKSVYDLANLIKQCDGKDMISYTVASVDMWKKHGAKDIMGGENIAETLCKLKVPVIKADNDRLNGWARIRESLLDAPDGTPYLQIFSTCNNLIRTLPTLYYDTNDHEDVDDHCEDHAAESLRYGLMSRPSPSREKAKAEKAAYQYNPLAPMRKQKESGFLNL